MINNGVYRVGFARSQEAYDSAVKELFDGLEKVSILFFLTYATSLRCISSKKAYILSWFCLSQLSYVILINVHCAI